MKRRDMQAAVQRMARHVERNLDHPAAGLNPFIDYFFSSLAMDTSAFSDFVRAALTRFTQALAVDRFPANAAPSKITHRLWLTDLNNPAMPPQPSLDRIQHDCLHVTHDYINIFWTNSPHVRSELEQQFRKTKAPLFCVDISSLSSDPLFERMSTLLTCAKFVLASDLLRMIILKRMGGIYSDLGVSYNREFIDLTETSNYTLFLGDGLFFQTSLLAAPPNSDLITLFHGFLTKPEIMPKSWVTNGDIISAEHEVNVLAGPAFSAICFLFINPSWRTYICTRDGQTVFWESSGSWYGPETKYGNVKVSESARSVLDSEKYSVYAAEIDEHVKAFNLPRDLEAKLRILCGLSDYFSNEPTDLCNIMYFQGSDKALSWHNYTHVYNYLLPQYRNNGDALLEVGIGTNNLDIESSMGVTGVPGASLRGWREFFKLANVHGADVDRRILFAEEGISTHYVDQLNRNTIEELWRQIPSDQRVAIVIDDGLHTFSANTNVYEESVAHNASMRLFIVEDVLTGYVGNWENYLRSNNLCSAIVALPNKNNSSDNVLIFIFNNQDV